MLFSSSLISLDQQQGDQHGAADHQGQEAAADAEGVPAILIQDPGHAVLPAAEEAAHEQGGHDHRQHQEQDPLKDRLEIGRAHV